MTKKAHVWCMGDDVFAMAYDDVALIEVLSKQADRLVTSLDGMPNRTTLRVKSYTKKPGDEIGPDDSRWSSTYHTLVGEMERDLKCTREDLGKFRTLVADWKPAGSE